jgi:hypothetical protein
MQSDKTMTLLSYREARDHVRAIQLTNKTQYYRLPLAYRRAHGLPSTPEVAYAEEGWKDWQSFLSDGHQFLDYAAARQQVARYGINSVRDYLSWSPGALRQIGLPLNPQRHYADEWDGWDAFFPTHGKDFRSPPPEGYIAYQEARTLVAQWRLQSSRDYRGLAKEQLDYYRLPSRPDSYYRGNGWEGWSAFLGQPKTPPSYAEAKTIVAQYDVATMTEYQHLLRLGVIREPLPMRPSAYYRNRGWVSKEDFLGRPRFVDYETARTVIQALRIRSVRDYNALGPVERRKHRLPFTPSRYYAGKGWQGWVAFLSLGEGRYLPYAQACMIAPKLGATSSRQWRKLDRALLRHHGLPASPDSIYKGKGWIGWYGFLKPKGEDPQKR